MDNFKGKQIIIADGDLEHRSLLGQALIDAGSRIVFTENNTQTIRRLDAISTYENYIDLIVIDSLLPPSNGYNTARYIRGLDLKTPIIFQTAMIGSEIIGKYLNAGCTDHIFRSYSVGSAQKALTTLEKYLKAYDINRREDNYIPLMNILKL